MKRKALIKQLKAIAKQNGWEYCEQEGADHTKIHVGTRFVMVPRHKEINELTARGILKNAKGQCNDCSEN